MNAHSKADTQRIITVAKENGEDFEFYPTTDDILCTIKADLDELSHWDGAPSVLDCGAGDGRALMLLTSGDRYVRDIVNNQHIEPVK